MDALKETDPLFLLLDKETECLMYYNRKNDTIFLLNDNKQIFGLKNTPAPHSLSEFYKLVAEEDRPQLDRLFYKTESEDYLSAEAVFRMMNADGMVNWINAKSTLQGSLNKDRVSILFKNVSATHYMEAFEQAERKVMEFNLSQTARLESVVKMYLLLLEEILPGMKLSVLKVVGSHLENVSSPSLPELYVKAVHNFPIQDNLGSCGTAAFRKERVIVEDVQSDIKWASLRTIAAECGIRSSWSQPFFNGNGDLLGTFALYYKEPRLPNVFEITAIERASKIISLIFTIFDYQKEVESNNEFYQFINLATKDAIYEYDAEKSKLKFGNSFNRLLGADLSKDNELSDINSLLKFIHPLDRERRRTQVADIWNKQDITMIECEYRIVKPDESVILVNESNFIVRDENGNVLKFIGVIHNITTERKKQLYRNLESVIYYAFAQDFSLNQIVRIVLNELGEAGNFSLGEMWLVNDEGMEIKRIETMARDEAGKKFLAKSESFTVFSPGQGIPGYVWQTQAPKIWKDLADHASFIRHEQAKESGLVSAIGIPLMAKGSVMGVFLLGSSMPVFENDIFVEVLKELGSLIGSEIVRKKQELEMRLLFERSPEVMAVTSPKGYFSKVNPAMCNLLGYDASEIEFVPFTQFIHPADLSKTVEEYKETITGERLAQSFINRYRRKDGTYRWLSWTSSEPYGEDGKVFAYGRDIHDWKIATDMLRESEKRYANLFQTSPLPLMVLDIETLKFIEVNQAAIDKYGYTRDEFLQMNAYDIRPESEYQALENSLEKLRETGKPTDIGVVKHLKKNGEIILADVRTTDIVINERQARVVVATDVTETMNHMDALQEQNRIMKEIAWIQSHIVRAPLARLMGIIDIMTDTDLSQEEQKSFHELLLKSARELDVVIMDIVQKANKLSKLQ